MIVTVLGSCVSACIRDTKLRLGGMNHFMLPATGREVESSEHCLSTANRYGTFAMENLINGILRYGGRKDRLEVKLFGGGRILAKMTDVGQRNIEFVRSYLEAEGLPIAASDLGDSCPRKVYYQPETGKVRVKRIMRLHNQTILEREREYEEKLEQEDKQPVELF
jgi:chemotaxis protein CheD